MVGRNGGTWLGEMEGHGLEERRDMVGRDGGHVGRDGGTWLGEMEGHGCKRGHGLEGHGMEGHGLEG